MITENHQKEQMTKTETDKNTFPTVPSDYSLSKRSVLDDNRSASDLYKEKKRKVTKEFFIKGALLIVLQCIVAVVLYGQIVSNDLPVRIKRELENRTAGEIKLNIGTYTGETDFGYLDGIGTFHFDSGDSYSGEWADNLLEGKAEVQIPLIGTYSGDYTDSKKNGYGVFKWSDGSVYKGKWKNDCMEGKGEYRSSNGTVYSGTFSSNIFSSGDCSFKNTTGSYVIHYQDGIIINAEIIFTDGTKYSGECSEKTISGTGKMVFANKDKYNGSFDNGKRNGSGVYIWSSGDTYDGKWQDDEMNGSGKYTFADGDLFNGSFSHNTFSDGSYKVKNKFGKYVFTLKNGTPINVTIKLKDGTSFTGKMNESGLNGRGQIKYRNGDTYEGSIKNGLKNGQGTYTWKSGASYSGSWKNDQMSGSGTYMYPSNEKGYKLSGTFSKGVPNGRCEYYVSSYEHYETDWSNGKCVKVYE